MTDKKWDGRPPFNEIKQALADQGFRPSRRLGQNFLLDPSLHQAIVEAAGVQPGDRVLEIGCGPGFLTAQLLAAGARVLAVEIDNRLIAVARQVLGEWDGLEFLNEDVLAGKNRLTPRVEERIKEWVGDGECRVVANLPYSISGPVLALLATSDLPLSGLVCLVQKELAERVMAKPGDKEWGTLALAVQLRFSPRYLRTVSPQVFRPRPKVDSGLVSLAPLAQPLCPSGAEAARLLTLARGLFTLKRKTLQAALGKLQIPHFQELLARAGLAGERRVRTLNPEEIKSLFQGWPDPSGSD